MKIIDIKKFFEDIDNVIRDYYISSDEMKKKAEDLANLINKRHDMSDGYTMGYLSALADLTECFGVRMFKKEENKISTKL